jgi:phage regulator Rha-like protein
MSSLILTPQQISVSLEDKNGELRLDSRIVADGFGMKDHTDYRRKVLEKYELELADLGVVFKSTLPTGEIVWFLNQAQVNFAGTLARNTDKAVKFKLNLVKAFEIAKQIIPAQNDRIRELELQIQLAQAEAQKAIAEKTVLDTRHLIVSTCPEPIQQKILGYTESLARKSCNYPHSFNPVSHSS